MTQLIITIAIVAGAAVYLVKDLLVPGSTSGSCGGCSGGCNGKADSQDLVQLNTLDDRPSN